MKLALNILVANQPSRHLIAVAHHSDDEVEGILILLMLVGRTSVCLSSKYQVGILSIRKG